MSNKSIIGVSWSHPSGACLIENNKVKVAVSEERFTRCKNETSFPWKSIEYCKSQASNDIQHVAFAENFVSYHAQLLQKTKFSVRDMLFEQKEYWYPKMYKGIEQDEAVVLKKFQVNKQYPVGYWDQYDENKAQTFNKDRLKFCSDLLQIPSENVSTVEHHKCHVMYGYGSSPFVGKECLVITIDGSGDGRSSTVSIVDLNGNLKEILSSKASTIGRVYSYTTLILGMKRNEHEYKVMGLAPYAKEKYYNEVVEIFNNILSVEGLDFVSKDPLKDMYFDLKDRLEGYRFDNIAGAVQSWIEDVLVTWVDNLISHTGIRNIVISGGVSMNVKAMGRISKLESVNDLFIAGSSSDDSLCVGAGMSLSLELNKQITKCENLYLGPNVENLDKIIKIALNNNELDIIKNCNNNMIAKFLSKGKVIARCVGRSEFGQRSLGNRSILADPTVNGVVEKINQTIKQRDFWMPFAPVVLDSYSDKYLHNTKKLQSPHMTIGFDTTNEGYESMKYACHPADKTARAQILTEEHNPDFYDLLVCFSKQTGRGALLNTSFNLHGYPIVNNAIDAFDVFQKGRLDGLILEDTLILRK